MRIKNAWWGSPPPDLEHEDEGFDIHVLANGVPSRGLLQVLRIEYEVPDPADPHGPPILQETNASVASNHNITIRFIPQFNFQPAGGNDPKVVKHTTPMAPNPADQTPAVPVTVHMGNGQVRLTAPLPSGAGVLRNFIIRVTITDEKDTSSNKDFSGHPAIRIHLHDNIRSA
jgi:hypothetical protein